MKNPFLILVSSLEVIFSLKRHGQGHFVISMMAIINNSADQSNKCNISNRN